MACLFATSFPPLIGYSSIVTMAGKKAIYRHGKAPDEEDIATD